MRALLLLPLFLYACDGSSPAPPLPETTSVATSSIGVTLDVSSNGASILFDAKVGSSTSVLRLGPTDAFSASAPDAPEAALGEYSPGRYTLLMPSQSRTVSFSFLRSGKSVSTTMLTLPTPFRISAPAIPSRAMGVALGWEAGVTGERLALTVEGACLSGMKLVRSPDPLGGGFTVQSADFTAATGTCKLEVGVERTATMPTALVGLAPSAGATLVQSRNLEIVTQP